LQDFVIDEKHRLIIADMTRRFKKSVPAFIVTDTQKQEVLAEWPKVTINDAGL
jgi:hypothetical protein